MKILHRLFALLLIGVLLVGCLPTVSAANSGKSGDLTWTFKDGVLTFSGKGSSEDLDAHSVGDWYVHADKITSVVFTEGVTRIGEYLFYDDTIYNSITSIRFPSSLKEIGEHAFTTLKGLKKVDIANLSSWCAVRMDNGSNPMDNRVALHVRGTIVTNLVIPKNVKSIGAYAFKGCQSLRKVTIHAGVEEIGPYAFNTCSNLKEMYFEGSAPKLGQHIMTLTKATVYTPAGDSSWDNVAKSRLDKQNALTWETYSPKTTEKTTKATKATTAKTTVKTTEKTTVTPTEKTTAVTTKKSTATSSEKTTAEKSSAEKTTATTTEAATKATTTVPTALGEAQTQTDSTPNSGWWMWALGGGVIVAALLGFFLAKRLTKR